MPRTNPRSVLSYYLWYVEPIVLFFVAPFAIFCLDCAREKGPTPHTVVSTPAPVADEGEQEADVLVQNPTPGEQTVRRTLTLIVEAGNQKALQSACDGVLDAIRMEEVRLTAHLLPLGGTDSPAPEALPNGMDRTNGKWYFSSVEGKFLELYPLLEPKKYFELRTKWEELPLSSPE